MTHNLIIINSSESSSPSWTSRINPRIFCWAVKAAKQFGFPTCGLVYVVQIKEKSWLLKLLSSNSDSFDGTVRLGNLPV